MRGRGGLFVLAILASAAVLTSSAGAYTHRSGAITISSRAEAVQYLASLGISARGVVVQRGSHNYAGPSCPGKGWTCTKAKRVLQVASREGDDNRFYCTPSTGGSSSPPNGCTIIQVSSGGQNVAFCREQSDAAMVDQDCSVRQTNTTGGNWLLIDQQVNAHNGAAQTAHQYGGSLQQNGSGPNAVEIHQALQQQTQSTDSTGAQTQNGHQEASVTQFSDSGANAARIDQSLALHADAKGGASVTQTQNADGDINTNAGVDQSSNSGRNFAQVNQQNQYDAHVGKAVTATQQQGSTRGGESVFFSQSSSGLSTADGDQQEHQNMQADRVGSLTQSQFGPMWSDPEQFSNPNNVYDVDQRSDQHASSPAALQDDQQYGECDTSGRCTVDQRVQQQGQSFTNSCGPATTCDSGQHVIDGTQTPCTGTSETACSAPPPPPPPPFEFCPPTQCCSDNCITSAPR